jgi:hypothetical protein
MRTHLECIPCFFKQALEALELSGAGLARKQKTIKKLSRLLSSCSYRISPPYLGKEIYQLVIKETGTKDPFYRVKNKSNRLALGLYPKLKRKVSHSKRRFLVATELAIAGNIIDFGAKNSLKVEDELRTFLKGNFDVHSRHKKAIFSYPEFKRDVKRAQRILYLGDNAGEIVFDRILIEEIKRTWPDKEIVFVVRGGPIINDVLERDARYCGMNKVAQVISSGSKAPGLILDDCSQRFLRYYRRSDLVISKGQGNFEALSGMKKLIYFLFRAKCPVVARYLGCSIGDIILHPNRKTIVAPRKGRCKRK